MYRSYETTCTIVLFEEAVAGVLDGQLWKEVTPEKLLKVDALLHQWIEQLELDSKREEELCGLSSPHPPTSGTL